MKEIYHGKVFALYSQLALVDAEDVDSYPQWPTGGEEAVLGPKGVVVSALADTLIDVIVYEGEIATAGVFYVEGEIQIGGKGLIVGNEVAGTSTKIPWPSGRSRIRVYGNRSKDTATQIVFVLNKVPD